MTPRPGHHRPLGTTTTMRFPEWPEGREPHLGDVAYQISGPGADDWDELRRSYLLVGIEECRRPRCYRLVMERVEYGTTPEHGCEVWPFFNLPRDPVRPLV